MKIPLRSSAGKVGGSGKAVSDTGNLRLIVTNYGPDNARGTLTRAPARHKVSPGEAEMNEPLRQVGPSCSRKQRCSPAGTRVLHDARPKALQAKEI